MPAIDHEYTVQGLKFHTSAEKVTKDWYTWQIELAGPKETLDSVHEVEYILHPTFPDRIRRLTNRKENFRLQSEGWGEFDIVVNVYFKDDDEKTAIVPLKLG